MRAVVIEKFGAPEGLAVVEVAEPVPAAGQVLIATEAIGVGGVDVVIRRGDLRGYGFREGHVPGGEVAGTVTAVGDGVDPGWLGRRVWAATGTGGGYAELAVAPVAEVVRLPSDLSAVDAVTIGGSGVVAHFALERAGFRPGEAVLVRGAAGGLGIMTVQLAARIGTVSVTTSSPERGRRLRELGATHVLDRDGESRVGEGGGGEGRVGESRGGEGRGGEGRSGEGRSGEGRGGEGRGGEGGVGERGGTYDVIVDVVAGAGMPSFLERLAPNGRYVLVGAIGGPPPADFGAGLMAAFQRSLSVATFSSASLAPAERSAVRHQQFWQAAGGDLGAVVQEVLPLDQAGAAHREMDAGRVFGRIVLTP